MMVPCQGNDTFGDHSERSQPACTHQHGCTPIANHDGALEKMQKYFGRSKSNLCSPSRVHSHEPSVSVLDKRSVYRFIHGILKLTELVFETSITISYWSENLTPKVKIKLNNSNHIF